MSLFKDHLNNLYNEETKNDEINLGNYLEAAASYGVGKALMNVIVKQLNKKAGAGSISFQPDLYMFTREGKILYGVMGIFSNGRTAIRFNFTKDKITSAIYSVDIYLKPSAYPQLSAVVDGLNPIQIITVIAKILKTKKTGAITIDHLSEITNEEYDDVIDDEVFTEARTTTKKKKVVKKKVVKKKVVKKKVVKKKSTTKKGKTGKEKKVIVKKAKKEKEKIEPANPKHNDLFDKDLTSKEIFTMLTQSIQMMKKGNTKSLLILGDPGIGKCVNGDTGLAVRFKQKK